MARIVFWSAGTDDGCTFYRCTEPARVLRERGHDAISGQGHGLGTLATADVVVIARPTEAETLRFMQQMRHMREATGRGIRQAINGPRLVVELDDDLFAVPKHFGELHDHLADPVRRARLRECLLLADRVTVTNQHLAERLHDETEMPQVGLDVRVVPNYVPARYVVDAPPQVNGTVTVGWAGSWTHRQDVRQLVEPLRALLTSRPDVRFHAAGHNVAVDVVQGLPGGFTGNGNRVWYTRWRDGVDGYLRSLDFHVGLAPLDDDLFNRSKSDVKLREYAARGIVAVASDVGPYGSDCVAPRLRVGNVHPLAEPWEGWLEFLAHDRRNIAGRAAHALAWAKRNTLEAHAGEWEDALL